METLDDLICLAVFAPVSFDSLHQIAGPPVMEKEYPLPYTPEWSCAELIGPCATLRDAVRKISTHVVDQEVGPEIHSLVGKRGTRDLRGAATEPAPNSWRLWTITRCYLRRHQLHRLKTRSS